MKSTGIVRKVDNLGRFVIPREIRKTIGIDAKQGMEIFVDGQSIIICKHQHRCVICESNDNLTKFGNKLICNDCVCDIKQTG